MTEISRCFFKPFALIVLAAVKLTAFSGSCYAQDGYDVQLTFDVPGGFYEDVFDLAISADATSDVNIFYTTDGTLPSPSNAMYTGPLEMGNDLLSTAQISQVQISPDYLFMPPDPDDVPQIIVIKAAAYSDAGEQVSAPVTHSYIIGALGMGHGELPVLSIAAEHQSLFDPDTGIFVPGVHFDASDSNWTGNYYQTGSEWEREIHVEFYEYGTSEGFQETAGLRTHGGNSRRFPQKGLRLYARAEYGESRFDHPVFEEKPIDSYKRFVLRPFMSSWSQTGIDDILSNRIAANLNADYVASRTVAVYINGECWGIYTMQERPDERYVQDNYNVNPNDVDMISSWWGEVVHGDDTDWNDLYASMEAADLTDPAQYAEMTERIDLDNFIDYQIFEIFIANYDWPANNMRCWRHRGPAGKWRWIFYDGDAALHACNFNGFAHATDTTTQQIWPTNAESTLFLRRFMENPDFHEAFYHRFLTLVDQELSAAVTTPLFEQVKSGIENEVELQISRFGYPYTSDGWEADMQNCLDFLECRPLLDLVGGDDDDEDEEDAFFLKVFPNPTSDFLMLEMAYIQADKSTEYLIYDVHGKLLANGLVTTNQTRIDMAGFAPAMYVVNVLQGGERLAFFKVLKSR